ncbi:hypothetical protein ANCCEY_08932 [Ancylostoma ceylanicum]|uniref:Uncharacterized protein n=2 Tax=Ancylostoma ceylanicum TaxID=53326 RepID=A0A0D6LPN5_9BILA|nr:hypothetical protein ANCCEY_08932 [Ancylostoma ceylanicum]EYC31191.1 hypothetical protein Y032_0004g2009 [Ancylostoma ceylanicum]
MISCKLLLIALLMLALSYTASAQWGWGGVAMPWWRRRWLNSYGTGWYPGVGGMYPGWAWGMGAVGVPWGK